jgi:class 3 adenylate cyclase
MAACATCGAALPSDARFCPACGAAVDAAALAEERKLATVLFADLVGSTALAAAEDPERTRATLDRFYEAMSAEIELAGGTVEKFAGDAVMAAFGAPAAHEDHAERALHAALSMRRRLAELFDDELQLRIGVNTGEVVVGRPREGSSFVSGDPVNVAARLEQAAGAGEILVGDRTAAATRGAFDFGEPRVVDARGKPGGVSCRTLLGALTLMRPRGVSGLRQAFVGRDAELELLRATYRRAAERGEPHLVTVVGDAGVGKTRLLRELWAWLAGQSPQPLLRTGRCLAYGQVTYWALGEVLKEHLGLLESDPPETARSRLGNREILGLALGLDVARDLHPLTVRDRLQQAWAEFLEELAAERPAVVLVEDLHWAEEPLLDLLERVIRDVRGPLLILGTGRPELLDNRPAWGAGRRNASLLWLDALTDADSSRMLEELLAIELPERLRTAIVSRAEGNPFFVEELLGSLIDQGFVVREDGRWTLGDLPDDFTVPDSVQAILAARIDLLGPAEKAGLQAASVLGRVFWLGPVRELAQGVDPDFDVLEDRDFIRRRSGSSMAGEAEYAFKHALTREIAYASVTKARRARLHARAAEWLERFGSGRDDLVPILAHHFAAAARREDADLAWAGAEEQLGELRGRAVAWLRRAADLATRRYALDEALTLLHRALELEQSPAGQAELWHAIGYTHALKFDGEPFWSAMQKAIELCDDEMLKGEMYSDLALQTAARVGMWRRLPEQELVDGWIDRALEVADEGSSLHVKAVLARAMWHRPEPAVARAAAVEATTLAERLGDPELRSTARTCRVLAALGAREYEEAATWAERGFELVEELRDPDLVADVYAAGGLAAAALGRFREAQRLVALHDDVTRTLTSHHRVHGVALLLEVEELMADWRRIRELEAETTTAIEANLDTPCVRNSRSLLVCAAAAAAEGEQEHARRLEERADQLMLQRHGRGLDGPRLRLALVRDDRDALAELVDPSRPLVGATTFFTLSAVAGRLEALAVLGERAAVEEEAPPLLRRRTYLEPFALRALGQVREDEELIRQALARFEAMQLGWHAERTRLLLG